MFCGLNKWLSIVDAVLGVEGYLDLFVLMRVKIKLLGVCRFYSHRLFVAILLLINPICKVLLLYTLNTGLIIMVFIIWIFLEIDIISLILLLSLLNQNFLFKHHFRFQFFLFFLLLFKNLSTKLLPLFNFLKVILNMQFLHILLKLDSILDSHLSIDCFFVSFVSFFFLVGLIL